MPIVESDLEYRFTNPLASAGNQLAQDDAASSLGGYLSTTVWTGGVLHDLFPAVTGSENSGLVDKYRCLIIINKHASLTWTSPVLWLVSQVNLGANVAIGVDTTVAKAIATNQQQALITLGETLVPDNVVFSAPTSKGTGLALGSLPPRYGRAIWIRLTAANNSPLAGDGVSIRAEGDTL